MDTNQLLQAVTTVGFPIVVAGYLLVRMEGKIEALQQAINQLTSAVTGKTNM